MSFDDLKQHGDGPLDFRLEVEGWPVEWVTNPRITHASGADGRLVHGGLHYAGIEISERIVMAESLLTVKPIAFKITPPHKYEGASTQWTDDATYWLARELDPVEQLGTALAYDATSIAFQSGASWANGTVFFLNTETIRVTTWPTIERGLWGSQAQAHPLDHELPGNPAKYDVYVYTGLPPTMEGRRVFLYAYGEGDDPAGDGGNGGEPIWRGMISRVPYTVEGNSWVLDCQPITHVLNQNVAGAIEDAHVIGIYHHQLCPFAMMVHFDGTDYGPAWYTGFDASESDFIANVNSWISAQLTAWNPDLGLDYFTFFGLVRTTEGLQLQAHRSSEPSVPFILNLGSVLVGFALVGSDGRDWKKVASVQGIDALGPGEPGYIPLTIDADFVAFDTGYAYSGAPCTVLGDCRPMLQASRTQHYFTVRDFRPNEPPWRIYVDTDMTGVANVYINGTRKPDGIFRVTATGLDTSGTDRYYVEVEEWKASTQVVTASGLTVTDQLAAGGYLGHLTKDTVVDAVRSFDVGTVADFMRALKVAGRDFANAADAPFITDSDISDLDPDGNLHPLAQQRVYTYLDRVRVLDIITQELRFIGHFLRLDAQGKIGCAKLPAWTEASVVDALHEIDGSSILTQVDGTGSPPKYTPNSDGRITMIKIQQQFLPRTKEWADAPAVFVDRAAMREAKGRGKVPHEIKLYSAPLVAPDANVAAQLEPIASQILSFFSRQYPVVEVEVPYTKFDVLCGDIVSLTHPDVPDAEGARGVTGRRGVVIERNWNLDPANARRGRMKIMLTARGIVGYAPSGFITDVANVSGNTWDLELHAEVGANDRANMNATMAGMMSGGGFSLASHFGPGDFIRVYLWNSYTPDVWTGVVQSVVNETVRVTFDDTFEPLEGEETLKQLVIEFGRDMDGTGSTSSQKRYAYQANEDALLPNGNFARRLS